MKHHFKKLCRSYWLIAILIALLPAVACNKGSQMGGSPSAKDFSESVSSGKTLVKVGDFEIKEGYLELIGRLNPQLKAQIDSPMGRQKLLDTITEQELLYQASSKAGLENDATVQEKINLYKRVIIAQAYVEKELQKRIEDYYNEHQKDEFEQVHIAHIYLRTDQSEEPKKDDAKKGDKKADADKAAPAGSADTKQKATETIKLAAEDLKKGTDFAKVAETYSEDNLTKKKGGDLGWVSRNDKRLARKDWQPLIDKAFAMKQGEVSDIIETKDGLHIIKVVEASRIAPLAEVQNNIRLKVGATVKKDVVDTLKKEVKVEKLVADEKPAPGAPADPHAMPHGGAFPTGNMPAGMPKGGMHPGGMPPNHPPMPQPQKPAETKAAQPAAPNTAKPQ